MTKKSMRSTAVFLWLVLAVMLTCSITLFAAADDTAADTESAVVYTTGTDMAKNKENLWGEVATPSALLSVKDGVITPNSGYRLFYNAEVQAVDLEMQITNPSESMDIAFALRLPNIDANKAAKPNASAAAGYWVRIATKSDAPAAACTVELAYSDGTVPAWNNKQAFDWVNVTLWNGNKHHVRFSAEDLGNGQTKVAFGFDNGLNQTIEKVFPTLPIKDTGFFINNVNTPATYKVYYEETTVVDPQPEPAIVTGKTMASNIDKCLTDVGGAACTVQNGVISVAEGKFFYNDASTQGVDIDLRFADTETTDIAFALRASTAGTLTDPVPGYWAHIVKQNDTSVAVRLYASDGTASPQEGGALGTSAAEIDVNIFDGEVHNLKFSATDKGDDTTNISCILDDKTTQAATADAATLPTANTGFYSAAVDSANPAYEIYENYQPPVTPQWMGSATMAENPEKVLKDYNGAAQTVTADRVPSEADKFAYADEVTAFESYVRFTHAANKQVLFELRATNGSAPWNGVHAYIAVLEAKKVGLYRVDDTTNPWNSKCLAAKADFSFDIFDGDVYHIGFYAVENAKGNVEVGFQIENEIVKGYDYETPLPITGTKFYTQGVSAGSVAFEFLPTYTPPRTAQFVDVDAMIFAKLLYDGASKDATQVKSLLDVVTVPGGKLVYNKAIAAANLEIKITSGEELWFALRTVADTTEGRGYFFKAAKATAGTDVTLYKRAAAGEDMVELATAHAAANLFDGEKHRVKLQAFGTSSVLLTAAIDPVSAAEDETPAYDLSYTDETSPISQSGTMFVITYEGTTAPAFKLYGANGVDIVIPEKPYSIYTGKSFLKSAANWQLSGAIFKNGNIEHSVGEQKARYVRTFKNAMYNFDVQLEGSGGWFATFLNSNLLQAIWNTGFHSIMARIQGTALYIEYWFPQQVFATIPLQGVDLSGKFNMECGLYTVADVNGKDHTFVRVAIDGTELYNEPLPEGSYTAEGALGFMAYGNTTFTVYPTETEIDKLPSGSNGAEETRENEDAVTSPIAVDAFAPITHTFAPAYKYEGNEMILGGRGDVSYGNRVDFTKLRFDFRFDVKADAAGQYLEFFFNRKRQDQFVGAALARDPSNYGYGVRLLPDGTVELLKTNTGSGYSKPMTIYPADGEAANRFDDGEYHTVTLYREKTAGGGLKISVFIDDDTLGYSYTDTDYYEINYPMDGYISFAHSVTTVEARIKDIVFAGTQTAPEETVKAQPCNFVTYYPAAEGEENGGYVYFVPQGASSTTKWVDVVGLDGDGEYAELLGRAFYPSRRVEIPATYTGDKVLVVAVGFTSEGNWTRELALHDTEAEHTVPQDEVERIAIREDDEGAHFVYAESGKKFMPVGGNYMSLRGGDHSTFDADTSFTKADYDPVKTDAMMREFSAAGGTMIRVFLIGRTSTNPGISGDSSVPVTNTDVYYEGLYIPYMENVAHFLQKAKQYGVYVMLTLGDADVPNNAYYLQLQGDTPLPRNMMYLSQNGIAARTAYAANVTDYFVKRHPDLVPAIFSIAFQNEFAMYGDQAPFSESSGTFTAANGKTYDMSSDEDRQACFDEGVVYYLNAMTAAVKAVDPNMLVNEGSFTLNAVGNADEVGCPAKPSNGDARYPATFVTYLSSNIDFLDVHIYYRNRGNTDIRGSFINDLNDMKFFDDRVQELLKSKPIFMGEFGADTKNHTSWDQPTGHLPSAHDAFIQTVECAQEVGFQGFCVWTMESHLQTTWWNLLSADGTFSTFEEMVAAMLGNVQKISASAANVVGKKGESVSITVTGTVAGDKVYYRTSTTADWSETNPVFTETGTYTVYYKVVRDYVKDFESSATVTIGQTAPDDPDKPDPNKPDPGKKKSGCGGQVGVASGVMAMLLLCGAATQILYRKRRLDR